MVDYNRARAHIEGSTVVLTCSFLADPRPTVEWLHNGMSLTMSSRHLTVINYTDLGAIENGTHILTIRDVRREEDNGNYTCRASNSYGDNNDTQNLVILGQLMIRNLMSNISPSSSLPFSLPPLFPSLSLLILLCSSMKIYLFYIFIICSPSSGDSIRQHACWSGNQRWPTFRYHNRVQHHPGLPPCPSR